MVAFDPRRLHLLALDLPAAEFDGVFANASLFHVPSQELPRVLAELRDCLHPGGVLFASNPRGRNQEGWRGRRYCAFHDLERLLALAVGAGFDEVRHYYRSDGLPREQQPWLARRWRRPAGRYGRSPEVDRILSNDAPLRI